MAKASKRHIAIALFMLGLIWVIYTQPYLSGVKPYLTTVLGALLVAFAYFTGLMAIAVGIGMSTMAFFLSLPFIAPLYALVISAWSILYKGLFAWVGKKVLTRLPPVQRLMRRIQTSGAYTGARERADSLLSGMGLMRMRKMMLFEVTACPHCGQNIPVESKACMHCKKEVSL